MSFYALYILSSFPYLLTEGDNFTRGLMLVCFVGCAAIQMVLLQRIEGSNRYLLLMGLLMAIFLFEVCLQFLNSYANVIFLSLDCFAVACLLGTLAGCAVYGITGLMRKGR